MLLLKAMFQEINDSLLSDLSEAKATLFAFDPNLADNPSLLAACLICLELKQTSDALDRIASEGIDVNTYEQETTN